MEITNNSKLEEYGKFKAMCPNAKELVYPDGSRSLVFERDGEIYFKLDYIKQGQFSEVDILKASNSGNHLNTVEDILAVYDATVAIPLTRNTNVDQAIHYYRVTKGLPFMKGLISEIKKLNPEVEISGQWVRGIHGDEQLTLITSVPIEKLNQPTGYYSDLLGRILISETEAEFSQSMNADFINYTVSENMINQFARALQEENPEAIIRADYFADKGIGRINSSIPLSELKYPLGYFGGFALDSDGFVGYLKNRIVEYKADGNEFFESTQKYYASAVYQKRQEDDTLKENQEMKEEPTLLYHSEDSQKEELNRVDKLAGRRFTILQRERAMSDTDKKKNRAEVIAGILALAATVSLYFHNQDIHQMLQHQLTALTSMESFNQYMGPIATMLSAASGVFMARYLRHSNRFKKMQEQFATFDVPLEYEQILGGNKDAKSR